MQNNHLALTGEICDEELENHLDTERQKLLRKAVMKGKHFAKQNRPELKGDSLDSYISDIIAGHEVLIVHVNKKLQPDFSKTKDGCSLQ